MCSLLLFFLLPTADLCLLPGAHGHQGRRRFGYIPICNISSLASFSYFHGSSCSGSSCVIIIFGWWLQRLVSCWGGYLLRCIRWCSLRWHSVALDRRLPIQQMEDRSLLLDWANCSIRVLRQHLLYHPFLRHRRHSLCVRCIHLFLALHCYM